MRRLNIVRAEVNVDLDVSCYDCQQSMKKALAGKEFGDGLSSYEAAELSDATITIFGELDAKEAKTEDAKKTQTLEAEAIASEIFNRIVAVKGTKITDLKQWLADIEDLQDKAKKMHDKAEWKKTQDTIASMQKKAKVLSLFLKQHKFESSFTLTHIATATTQFLGYAKAKSDLDVLTAKSSLAGEECSRQCQRWAAAKAAVKKFGEKPAALNEFIKTNGLFYYNLANSKGTRTKKAGDVRIGGNDFFEGEH